jgi:hopene-associated glycosyltransferase HpnB
MIDTIALISLAIWLYLMVGRGGFWLASERDDWTVAEPRLWPRVTIVVPARNEAKYIGESIGALLRQDYPGPWDVILVDDDSGDGTGEIARRAAARLEEGHRLQMVEGCPLPGGWTGKLWALKQGTDAALRRTPSAGYILLVDADIVCDPDVMRRLVARAEEKDLVLTSLMAKLRCENFTERSQIPAFIYFFQMLYPFSWSNRADRATAAAAGGCLLLRADAFTRAGGIDAIRSALIDDCATAKLMKGQGGIWVGLTERVRSIRAYAGFDVGRMVSRSAYTQLRCSPVLLLAVVAAMAMTFLAPPLLAVFADGFAAWAGAAAWVLMTALFQPTLRLYRLAPLWGLAMPAIAFAYTLFTIHSGLQFARGKGGLWKGRVQAAHS